MAKISNNHKVKVWLGRHEYLKSKRKEKRVLKGMGKTR